MFLNSLPPGAYLEETLDQPLDLSIKRASDYHDSDSRSNSSNSSDSSYGNDDRADEDAERIEDLRLYNLLRENSNINGESTINILFLLLSTPYYTMYLRVLHRNASEEP